MILAAIAAAAAIAEPRVVATISPQHRIVEGVASNGQTIWVSSVLDRQILACSGSCQTIATLPEGASPLGIAWDWSRGVLWIAADCPDIPGVARCQSGALYALNGRGKLLARFVPATRFHPGDVSVSLHGVFVSDSQSGLVYALLPRRPGLRPINRPGEGKSAQGTALAPDGVSVIVADYGRGIGRVDLKSTATKWLPLPDGKPLRGVDGLTRCGESYFGIFNGAAPNRLLSIRAQPGGVESREIGPALTDATQIAFDGKRLLVVTNAGWDLALKPQAKRREGARIIAVDLPRGCRS